MVALLVVIALEIGVIIAATPSPESGTSDRTTIQTEKDVQVLDLSLPERVVQSSWRSALSKVQELHLQLPTATATPDPTPTLEPTVAPLPTAVEPSFVVVPPHAVQSWPIERVIDVICDPQYLWDCGWALATTWCESNWDPTVQGHEQLDLNGDGVLEDYYFNSWWQVAFGSFDPYINTQQAYAQWVEWQRNERARPWPNCP